MGWLSSLFDPAGVIDNAQDVFDPAGSLLDSAGLMPDWFSEKSDNINENLNDWASNLEDFEKSQLSDWTKRFKNDPTQLLIGAGDPFSAKMWGKITGKDYDPYVNQYGGPTKQAYQSAEDKGIDTSDSRGSHAVAQTIASLYGGAGMGAGLGAAGNAAGIGAAAGQALGGAAAGAGNAWANDSGNIFQSALAGALPGLSQMFGGALNNVNTGTMGEGFKTASDTFNEYNKASNGLLGGVGKGIATGAIGSAIKGDKMGEGALQGGLQGGLGNLFGQGISALGGGKMSGNLGNALAGAGMGMYAANQAKKDIQGQIGQLQSLFSGNSPYAQQLQQQLARKDAASGRRSQYGPREVELQARLAEMNSRNAPQLNSLYNQKSAAQLSQYKDLYNVLRQSGLMNQLGDMGKKYFQGYGDYNQGQVQGPPMASMYENQEY